MKLLLSPFAGFCFGVQRAADQMEALLNDSKNSPVYTLGELIHNRDFNDELASRGVQILEENALDSIPDGAVVVLRTHGVPADLIQALRQRNIKTVDATCPFVSRLHAVLEAEKDSDTHFLIFGDQTHPEIKALLSHARPEQETVFASLEELKRFPFEQYPKLLLLSQTTACHSSFRECADYLLQRVPDAVVRDTVCEATDKRQEDAEQIARKSDLMIVIGARHSSNTKKLADISARFCKTLLVERASEIPNGTISPTDTVGITAGASTPRRIIEEVIAYMTNINNEDNMSFEEMLEQSFRTISPGEVVTGTITRILPAEMHVDLGIKHTGILPQEEVSDNSSLDLLKEFKLGDEITVLVQKFNDAEGTVQVSKKKLDNRAGWQKIVEAHDADATLSGTVAAAIKGGILVAWEGQSIFIPGSLSGLPKEADLRTMVGKPVQFKLCELDEQKRRTVGSIRAVQREQRKALAEQFWQEVAPGKVYTGKVKSITSYGAFVDLGGADGMVHITELSWKRLSHPSEVVSIGQEVTVYVKDVNYDTKKISLGYKTEAENPWNSFLEKYHVGDVVKVTIVNMTPFGAFAEIVPGVDGLIHISQITTKHLTKPQDVLCIGEAVDAEIIGINADTKKISLSMRSLLPQDEVEAEGEETAAAEADATVKAEETQEVAETAEEPVAEEKPKKKAAPKKKVKAEETSEEEAPQAPEAE